jgi:hypothetical protein
VNYFDVEGVGEVVVACVVVLDEVLAGGGEGEGEEEEAGVEGAVDVDGSEVLGGESFFSPV